MTGLPSWPLPPHSTFLLSFLLPKHPPTISLLLSHHPLFPLPPSLHPPSPSPFLPSVALSLPSPSLSPSPVSAEFLWQEGHTAHATADDAVATSKEILDMYASVCEVRT
jgi:hypothetical protein